MSELVPIEIADESPAPRARDTRKILFLASLATVGVLLLTCVGLGIGLNSTSQQATQLEEDLEESKKESRSLEGENRRLASTVRDYEGIEDNLIARGEELDTREAAVEAREQAVTEKETIIAKNTFAGNGLYVVGVDIEPGRYRSDGGANCYWSRLNASGDDIIDNHIGSGPTVVTVQPSDGILEVSRCAEFTKF